jgi:hypothetical protein
MQSTASCHFPATPRVHFTVPLPNIQAAFRRVPDPRRRQGTRYPLAAILTMAVAAILCNHRSLLAIAEWGTAQTEAIKRALGFPTTTTPHVTTLHRLFRRLDPAALAAALTDFFDPQVPGELRPRGSQGWHALAKPNGDVSRLQPTARIQSMQCVRCAMTWVSCWHRSRFRRRSRRPN